VEFACLGVSFRIFLEGDSEFFLSGGFRLFQCNVFIAPLNRQYRIDCSVFIIVIIYDPKRLVRLSVYSLSTIATVFV